MNGQHVVWYRTYPFRRWACFLRKSYGFGHNPSEQLRLAENMMKGDHSDVLWRKQDEAARRLIWC